MFTLNIVYFLVSYMMSMLLSFMIHSIGTSTLGASEGYTVKNMAFFSADGGK